MKVCILSDTHDNRSLLIAALQDAKSKGAEAVLHCGDVVASSTIRGLGEFELPMHVIHGNNTGDVAALHQVAKKSENLIQYYGQDAELELGGRKIFVVHYPHYAYAMCCTGDWDVVCYGHTHQADILSVPHVGGGATWLVNPGSLAGQEEPPTYVMGNLETLEFTICPLNTG